MTCPSLPIERCTPADRRACDAAGTQTVADGQRDVILAADVKDVIPVPAGDVHSMSSCATSRRQQHCVHEPRWRNSLICEVLRVLQQAQLRSNRWTCGELRHAEANTHVSNASTGTPKIMLCSCQQFCQGTLAWMDPPRLTMPVMRLAVSGTYRSRTPAFAQLAHDGTVGARHADDETYDASR